MDVRCPQCGTLFEFDEEQMKGAVVTLKCSVCDHLFRLESKSPSIQENQRRWMVRNLQTGDVLYFSGFDVLHRWILEGKVGRTDEISRTGEKWTALSEIGEFMPIFQVVESIQHISNPAEVSPAAEDLALVSSHEEGPPPEDQRARKRTMQQFVERPPAPSPSASSEDFGSTSEFERAPIPTEAPPAPSASSTPSPRPETIAPEAHIADDAPVSRSQSGRVRLDPRMSGGASGAEPGEITHAPVADDSDEWSLGALGTTLEEPQGETVDQAQAPASSTSGGRRWGLLLFILVVVVGGSGAGVFWLERDRLTAWWERSFAASSQTLSEELATSEPAAPTPSKEDAASDEPFVTTPAIEPVHAALARGEAALSKEHARLFTQTQRAAAEKLAESVQRADARAERHARRGNIDLALSDAKRAYEDGKYERARSLYHDALDIDSRDAEATTGLAWSLLSLGRSGSAAAQFRRALSINERYEDAYIGLGRAERSQGNLEEALQVYETYLGRFPNGRKASIATYQRDQIREQLGR